MRVLEVILPSAGALLFFVLGLRAVVQADRRERSAADRLGTPQSGAENRPAPGPPSGTPARTDDADDETS